MTNTAGNVLALRVVESKQGIEVDTALLLMRGGEAFTRDRSTREMVAEWLPWSLCSCFRLDYSPSKVDMLLFGESDITNTNVDVLLDVSSLRA